MADRSQRAELGCPELRPRLKDHVTGANVLAGAADGLAGGDLGPDHYLAALTCRVLDPDDGVSARGEHRAGRDRDRLTRPQPDRRGMPGARLADEAEAALSLSGVARVRGEDGVSVHRRVVEPRHGVGGSDVGGEDPAERLAQGHRLGREERSAGEHRGAGVLDRRQLGGHGANHRRIAARLPG